MTALKLSFQISEFTPRPRSDERIDKTKSDVEKLFLMAPLLNADNDHALYVKDVFNTLVKETKATYEQLKL